MANRLLEDIKNNSQTTSGTSSNRLLQDIKNKGVDISTMNKVANVPEKTIEDKKSTLGKVGSATGNVLLGVGKGGLSTVKGTAGLGEKMLNSILQTLLPKKAEEKLGISEAPNLGVLGKKRGMETSAEQLQTSAEQKLGMAKGGLTTPTNTAQKIGFGAEQIGEFFIPGGASTKLGKAAELATKGGKTLKGLARLGGRMAGEAGIVGGQTLAQTGGDVGDSLTSALLGASMPVAGKILGGLSKAGEKVALTTLGKTTGAGYTALKKVVDDPNVIKFAREAGADGAEGLQIRALESAKNAKKILQEKASTEYQSALEKIKVDKTNLDDAAVLLRKKATNLVSADKFDIRSIQKVDSIGNKINDWDFSKSTITEKSEVVKKALNDVYSWDDWSAKGLDVLKKRLFDFADDARGSKAEVLVKDLAHDLDKSLKKMIPKYEEMTSKWRKWRDLGDELDKTLSLSDKAQRDTSIKKLMSTLRENNDLRKGLVDILTETGEKDITSILAGSQVSALAPRGLSAGVGLGVAGVSLANPASWPLAVAYLGSSSPRLVAEFLNIIGKAKRTASGLIEMTPILRTQIKRIFDQADNKTNLGK